MLTRSTGISGFQFNLKEIQLVIVESLVSVVFNLIYSYMLLMNKEIQLVIVGLLVGDYYL